MKIGFIIYGSLDDISGGYLYDRKLVASLREQGETVEVVSLPWRNYAAHLTDNFWFRLPRGFDVLVQDELNHPSLLVANRSRRPYPVVSLVHHLRSSESRPGWQNVFYKAIEQSYLRSVDGFIFNSQTSRNVVSELVENSPPGIIANPPVDRFGEPISETEIVQRSKAEPFRVLFLGNLLKRKGLHTLLDSFEQLYFKVDAKNETARWRLDIVGSLESEPGYSRSMQKLVEVNRLVPIVHFHGALDNEPLVDLLENAHVMVIPSSYEGYGIAYLEGMCFGLPAIATTSGAANEIITDGVDGFLINAGDSAQLADRLNTLAGDRPGVLRMSLAARQRYQRQPTWKQTGTRIRQFLHQISS